MSSLRELVDAYERMVIMKTLTQNDYDRSQTADALGVPRTTLWNLLRKHGLLDFPRAEASDDGEK